MEVFQAIGGLVLHTGATAAENGPAWIMACGARHLHPDDIIRLTSILGPVFGILLIGAAWAWRREVVARRRAQAAEMENLRLSNALERLGGLAPHR